MNTCRLEKLLSDAASPGIRPGLARLSCLCGLLDHPERSFRAIHVAGTNGKGSTAAYLSQIFEEAGYPCGLYTSPHLANLNERFLFRGEKVSYKHWNDAISSVLKVVRRDHRLRDNPPTFFELLTASVFCMIRDLKVPWVILEAGMGGRLDATNILPPQNILMSLITAIGWDHSTYLGGDLAGIAREKFAVVRPGRPALFLGDPSSEIFRFRSHCRRVGAFPRVFTEEWAVTCQSLCFTGGRFSLSSEAGSVEIQTPLLGEHQVMNAALAAAAAEIISPELDRFKPRTVVRGIAKTRWPGRLEVVAQDPCILLDGGHNAHAVGRVVSSLQKIVDEGTSVSVVYATMKDKDYRESLRILKVFSDNLYCTAVPDNSRGLSADSLTCAAREAGFTEVVEEEDPLRALSMACKTSQLVLCLGSLYFVGWLRERIVT